MNHRDYGRTTITVPMELKKKMKQVQGFVNWSAVACEAFELKLDEIGPIKEITSVAEAVSRMKQAASSIDASNSKTNENGFEAGKKWALNQANPDQLSRIEELRESMSTDQWHEHLQTPDGRRDLTDCVSPNGSEFRRRHGRRGQHDRPHKGQPWRARAIWRSILDCRPDNPATFFLGFADGALDVWKEIKDQL